MSGHVRATFPILSGAVVYRIYRVSEFDAILRNHHRRRDGLNLAVDRWLSAQVTQETNESDRSLSQGLGQGDLSRRKGDNW